MHRLAVFDIDGTLTDTNAVDDECFLRAIAETLSLEAGSLDWTDAPHVTDAGLLRWLVERYAPRSLRDGEGEGVQRRFLELLRAELAAAPARFRCIAGAETIFDALRERGWHIALATGGWEESARLKLRAIGIDGDHLVLASSSDAETRVEIMEIARLRAAAAFGGEFARIVSIGDGLWDVRAAAALRWPLVGIARGERAERLRAAGASTILPDLASVADVCRALDEAEVPPTTSSMS
jgi:phosphoglycolate phosphatase-like HAD superfamily hydrolase